MDPRPRGTARAAAALTTATTQVLAPALATRLGLRDVGSVSAEHPSLITPPGPAFAIWGPIFAAAGTAAVAQALPGRTGRDVHVRTGWWLAAAYAGNTAWELLAQSGRGYRATPVVLAAIVAPTAVAHARLQHAADGERAVDVAAGALLGWTAPALCVNLASAAGWSDPRRAAHVVPCAVALLGVAAGAAAWTRRRPRGALELLGAATWALGGAAVATPSRPLRVVAVAGAVTTAGAAVLTWRRRPRGAAAGPRG
ncbi:hypothetical protein GTR02_15340 [Kineococcus sp. R8]|uniref:hypothetical protein n=1 Tax=Kineococcus siccus TaxID=2696567 RepID=UPI001412D102|nr:hypothetical protein [Kineococcus siccus]NAZ83192.1 hypothetical protein [Kineococcus siccus]